MVALLSPVQNLRRDALLHFEKPLSRAREGVRVGCAVENRRKSLHRIEIPLSIYESRIGLGSFSNDPTGYDGGDYNLYRYVANNPLTHTDPTGLYGQGLTQMASSVSSLHVGSNGSIYTNSLQASLASSSSPVSSSMGSVNYAMPSYGALGSALDSSDWQAAKLASMPSRAALMTPQSGISRSGSYASGFDSSQVISYAATNSAINTGLYSRGGDTDRSFSGSLAQQILPSTREFKAVDDKRLLESYRVSQMRIQEAEHDQAVMMGAAGILLQPIGLAQDVVHVIKDPSNPLSWLSLANPIPTGSLTKGLSRGALDVRLTPTNVSPRLTADTFSANGTTLFSRTSGAGFDPVKLDRIAEAYRRTGGSIDIGSAEGVRRLDFFGAEASTLGDHITLRENPSRSAVFEELIHATQNRKGRFDGSPLSSLVNEIEAKEKLIRNRRAYGIPNAETKQTIEALRDYRSQLHTLQIGN
jgi:hypothetical protein